MQIHRDTFNGDSESVRLALDAGVDVDVTTDDDETTPLMVAVSSPDSNIPTLKLLLERGANPNAAGGNPYRPVLGHALILNDPDRVRLLLDAGADVAVVDESGFNALMWAIGGTKTHLLEIIELLLERDAPVGEENDYGDSVLSLCANRGRFDGVRRLLEAGADESCLGWTPLLRDIALGNLEDVRTRVEEGDDVSRRDSWERTPWLLAVAVGDVEKAKLLLAAGAKRDDVGWDGKTALMYAIETGQTEVLKWLVEEGLDLEAANDAGRTALIEAASDNNAEHVKLLLDAGADADRADLSGQKATARTTSPEVVRLLIAAGQDLNDLSPPTRVFMLGLKYEGELTVSLEDFEEGRRPRFGTANPEKMDVAFWRATVKSGVSLDAVQKMFSANGETPEHDAKPIWSYNRQGQSLTALPDGRFIEIGGSNEDWYDLHFHVYNDVIVHYPEGGFDIFGYPADVFPPTDFHSATFVNGFIYIIGCMGHMHQRVVGHTAVYRLNVETLAIERIETSGKGPGCISMHQGTLKDNEIHVGGGECSEDFILSLETHQWRRGVM